MFGFLSAWNAYQFYMAGFFLFLAGQYGFAIWENKWPKAKSSHIFFLILTLVSATVLFASGFFK